MVSSLPIDFCASAAAGDVAVDAMMNGAALGRKRKVAKAQCASVERSLFYRATELKICIHSGKTQFGVTVELVLPIEALMCHARHG